MQFINPLLLLTDMPPAPVRAKAAPAQPTAAPVPPPAVLGSDRFKSSRPLPKEMPPPASQPSRATLLKEQAVSNVTGVVRTTVMGAWGLWGGHVPPEDTFQTPKGKFMHRIFPGETVASVASHFSRTPVERAIPSGAVNDIIDPYQWMPNFVFAGKPFREDTFPVAAAYDGDNDVDNNVRNYRHGRVDGSQQPAIYVHTRTKGEYVVIQYWLYYVDNKYINYHNHDWEATSIYLKRQGNKLVPAFIYTSWHDGGEMAPWSNLQLDPNGRANIRVDPGGHGTLPFHRGEQPPADGGLTLRHDGTVLTRGSNQVQQTGLRFLSDDANVAGAKPPEQVRGGSVLDAPYGYNYSRIFGFIKANKEATSPGPRGRTVNNPGHEWNNPFHPSLFGFGNPN